MFSRRCYRRVNGSMHTRCEMTKASSGSIHQRISHALDLNSRKSKKRSCRRVNYPSRASAHKMILTRAPLRIPLGGGGTDLPSYYSRFGGFILSVAINKYVYICLNRPAADDLL